MNDMKMKEQDSRSSRQHISSSDLKAFKQDKLEPAELESFLNHIGSCLYCSDVLAEEMDHELIQAPVDMKENIINKSKQLGTQAAKRKTVSKQMQLLKYSLNVVAASLCAIVLIFSSTTLPYFSYGNINSSSEIPLTPDIELSIPIGIPVRDSDYTPLTASIRNNMDQFSNNILEFSNTIINAEVKKND